MLRKPQRSHFYPGNLAAQLDTFLKGWEIPKDIPAQLYGGVIPHAGWMYSGRTAARTLHTLIVRCNPRTVILLGAVHSVGIARPALYPDGAWETPLGEVAVDANLTERILKALGKLASASPQAHDNEHSLEVQMPLLRLLAPGCLVVPIAMPATEAAVEVGRRIAEVIAEEPDVVVVASTDLTHYGEDYSFAPGGLGPKGERWMRGNDARMVAKIQALAAEEILAEAKAHHNACGPGAVSAALSSGRERGSTAASIIEYTTSHQIKEEPIFSTAVGYVGAVF
ncbi:MAG: AmmeMemoRadiSam system protein B [Planctomycetota bacterium]